MEEVDRLRLLLDTEMQDLSEEGKLEFYGFAQSKIKEAEKLAAENAALKSQLNRMMTELSRLKREKFKK